MNELSKMLIEDNVAGVNVTIPASIVLKKFGFDLDGYWRNVFISVGLVIVLVCVLVSLVVFKLKERR